MLLDADAASGFFRGRLEGMADADQFTGAGLEFGFETTMEHFVSLYQSASTASRSREADPVGWLLFPPVLPTSFVAPLEKSPHN